MPGRRRRGRPGAAGGLLGRPGTGSVLRDLRHAVVATVPIVPIVDVLARADRCDTARHLDGDPSERHRDRRPARELERLCRPVRAGPVAGAEGRPAHHGRSRGWAVDHRGRPGDAGPAGRRGHPARPLERRLNRLDRRAALAGAGEDGVRGHRCPAGHGPGGGPGAAPHRSRFHVDPVRLDSGELPRRGGQDGHPGGRPAGGGRSHRRPGTRRRHRVRRLRPAERAHRGVRPRVRA